MNLVRGNDAEEELGRLVGTPNALKNIIRQDWERKFDGTDKPKKQQVMMALEGHAANMQSILNNIDYEVFCVSNIIAHAKHMTRDELNKYLSTLEAIGTGYAHIYDMEVATLIMIGVTARCKNIYDLAKQWNSLAGRIDSKRDHYNSKMEVASKELERLSTQLNKQESSLLSFFFRGRIRRLRGRIKVKSTSVGKIAARVSKYKGIAEKVRAKKST